MPFVSQAQAGKLWATNPDVAREFAAKTPALGRLPKYKRRKHTMKKRRKKGRKRPY